MLQDPEVARDRRQGDAERLRKLPPHRSVSAREPHEDNLARRIG